jgi:hypothetical protein
MKSPTLLLVVVGALALGACSNSPTVGEAASPPSATSEAASAPSAAPLSGSDDQARITAAVRSVKPSVVALDVTVNGTVVVPPDPFAAVRRPNG